MQIFLALAIVIFALAASVVGLKLLALARRTQQLPEFLVGLGCSLIGLLGYPLAMCSGFGRGAVSAVHLSVWGIGVILMNAGLACLYAFTAHVFRPRTAWARVLVVLLTTINCAAGLGSLSAMRAAPPDALSFQVTAGWTVFGQISSGVGFAWIGIEAWLQLAMARRREALGLADALVGTRFLAWVIFAISALGMNAVNTAALLAGVSSVDSVPVQAAMAVLGLTASACMYLAFLPAPTFRRWFGRAA
jgi:uncharacterized membrane protein